MYYRTINVFTSGIHGCYRHYKGTIYEAIALVKHSDSLENYILYKGPGVSVNPSGLWIKPKDDFFAKIDNERARFEKIDMVVFDEERAFN